MRDSQYLSAYQSKVQQIARGAYSAFVDSSSQSNLAYKPEFISNDYSRGRKVLSTVEHELQECESFCISVAFITNGGIEPLMQTLKELEERKIPGRILTTDYLNFSDPVALERLHGLKNIELRMYMAQDSGFHTKGYIFKDHELYRIIVGSSNMTSRALTQNKEWNTRVVSTQNGEYAEELLAEFRDLWNSRQTRSYEQFIDSYRVAYRFSQEQKKIARHAISENIAEYEAYVLKPNSMQNAFIASLRRLRKEGRKRALLISATGTGKTYACAFALREEKCRRALFLVHREQIAKQARKSFQRVFGTTRTLGLLSGNSKDFDTEYLFSTMQMMEKDEILAKFAPDAFDTIVIDEVHKAGSASYQKIMRHFHPNLWLGMTATPERTDGFDIYRLFDHNIAYEIRLQQALEEDLLCPFHYFGITDLELNGELASDEPKDIQDFRQFNYLTSDARVQYIMEKTAYYGYSGSRVKGLMFVSRKTVGEELCRKLNDHGLRTAFLSGEDSQEKREKLVERLTTDDPEKEPLDYILTVDIFNEGVDIPEINQVVLLRPTQSPIIFVQQLGRGLRKAEGKEFVVILDFIGNYRNNYMIPIALSGDRSYNKDNMRRYVADGARIIPGSSSVHFDRISRARIYASIDQANVNDLKLIRENYQKLKFKLGRIPKLADFDAYGEMDALHIIEKCGSYYNFLSKYEKDYTGHLNNSEEKLLEFISKKFANGKRMQELLLVQEALNHGNHPLQMVRKYMENSGGSWSMAEEQNLIHIMTNRFPSGSGREAYKNCILLQKTEDGEYEFSPDFLKLLENPELTNLLREVVDFGLSRYRRDYSKRYLDTDLVLYQKYTYEDVCRLLNWSHNEVPLNIGGYKYDANTHTFPVFVNYVKDETVVATQQYEDCFESPDQLVAISKSGRSIKSEDVQNFLKCRERGIAVHLFVRKNKDDRIKEFYYLGKMLPNMEREPEEFMLPGTSKTAVKIWWKLDVPVREDIYEYITQEEI